MKKCPLSLTALSDDGGKEEGGHNDSLALELSLLHPDLANRHWTQSRIEDPDSAPAKEDETTDRTYQEVEGSGEEEANDEEADSEDVTLDN